MLEYIKYIKNSRKILGMNARNLHYIRPYNKKRAKRIADEKLLSKRILKKGKIPVPKLIAKIRSVEELNKFDWSSLPSSFALKPNRGYGGGGILVVYGKKKPSRNASRFKMGWYGGLSGNDDEDAWVKADCTVVTVDDLKEHILNILD
ncbi:MAG TPA: sugar-transfer associated ATP-grasp domain-containing protein, partial [Candidatus Moranbacteria bacterium]|nr:sugar-transfer associated ATP-grasp domain-containing protein [Candidatus Moranbacteria bacterium]